MRVLLEDSERVVAAYVCPDAFVSRVVYFGIKPRTSWFQEFLHAQVGSQNVSPRDIRVASRHGWELGGKAREIIEEKLGKGAAIGEVYWTRYPKTDEQKQLAVSLCIGTYEQAGCTKLFTHNKNSIEKLCSECRIKYKS